MIPATGLLTKYGQPMFRRKVGEVVGAFHIGNLCAGVCEQHGKKTVAPESFGVDNNVAGLIRQVQPLSPLGERMCKHVETPSSASHFARQCSAGVSSSHMERAIFPFPTQAC